MRGVVHVHGHGQCLSCNTNIQPCCAGDSTNDAGRQCQTKAGTDAAPQPGAPACAPPGGSDATVTTDALLFVLMNRLGSDLDEARLVLEAAEKVGIIRTKTAGNHSLQDVVPSPVDPTGPAP